MFDACIESFDGDAATVSRCIWRKAKKEHRCYECNEPIYPGEEYEYATGLWEDTWSTFKTCKTCSNIRESMFHTWSYGSLWQDIWDAYAEQYYEGCEEDEDTDWLQPVSRFHPRREEKCM